MEAPTLPSRSSCTSSRPGRPRCEAPAGDARNRSASMPGRNGPPICRAERSLRPAHKASTASIAYSGGGRARASRGSAFVRTRDFGLAVAVATLDGVPVARSRPWNASICRPAVTRRPADRGHASRHPGRPAACGEGWSETGRHPWVGPEDGAWTPPPTPSSRAGGAWRVKTVMGHVGRRCGWVRPRGRGGEWRRERMSLGWSLAVMAPVGARVLGSEGPSWGGDGMAVPPPASMDGGRCFVVPCARRTPFLG